MKTIIVAGGAGFVGTNLVRSLLRRKDVRIVVIDKLLRSASLWNLADLPRHSKLEFFRADVSARSMMAGMLAEFRPAAFVNCAAETNSASSIGSPSRYIDGNVISTLELLEAVRSYLPVADRHDPDGFKYIHISSTEDFGVDAEFRLMRSGQASPYAASKAAADQLVNSWQHTYSIPASIASFGNCFGPYQSAQEPVPAVMMRMIKGQVVRIAANDRYQGDWVAVNDVCQGLLSIIDEGQLGGRYTFSSGIEMTATEMAMEVGRVLDEVLPATFNPATVERGISSYTELIETGGEVCPKRSGGQYVVRFRSALEETARWYVGNSSRIRLGTPERQAGGRQFGLAG